MQAASWRREGTPLTVAINISARGLAETDLAERVRDALLYSELPPSALCLEVSETAVLRGDLQKTRATLQACKDLGAMIALDNFGAGQSSLTLPGQLPIDAIKVDRSLINGFEHDRAKRAIVVAATAMAREADIAAVAVGIETEQQLQLARELGFHFGQGFFLCPPDAPELLHIGEGGPVRSPVPWRPISRLRRCPPAPQAIS
jgi:EAL domain-containing protein (putative c-di-GMP-specific phosphodiesterase class I)